MPAKTKSNATENDSPFKELSVIGEIDPGSESTVIKIREVEIAARKEGEKPRRVLDIRQFIDNKRYTGWGKGVSIPADQVEELRDFCDEYLELASKRKAKKAEKKAKK